MELSDRSAGALLGYDFSTIMKYRLGMLPLPRSVRLHMLALRKLGPRNRLALARIGWTIMLKQKEAKDG